MSTDNRLTDHDIRSWSIIGVLALVMTWAYFNSLAGIAQAWQSAQYSHGYLIPAFAAILLFLRRQHFAGEVPTWQRALGLGIIVVAMLIRIGATQRAIMTVDRLMYIPSLIGIFLIVGGLSAVRWSAPPLGFLVFMYPLPRFLEDGLLKPLQSLATKFSLYALQTLGIESYSEGNRIMLDQVQMGVVDACSGLRMLTIFSALAAAIAMISTNRPWWERITILFSAIPIALAVNVIRITITGLMYSVGVKDEIVKMVLHDAAGLIMMPMALGLLYLEYQILAKLVIEETPEQLSPIGLR